MLKPIRHRVLFTNYSPGLSQKGLGRPNMKKQQVTVHAWIQEKIRKVYENTATGSRCLQEKPKGPQSILSR